VDRRNWVLSLAVCMLLLGFRANAADLPLEYKWEDGMQYVCTFRVEAAIANAKCSVNGVTLYTPLPGNPSLSTAERMPSEATGTAFSISPHGVLVTCAHVVKGATEIEANFGEKVYKARVLAYDASNDLAILKIDAKNLPYLGFVDSDKVELAQEVRVVGYPLSSMLGESIKISRGTISGIIERDDEKRFQIDARVNPGNSGGPLVDQQGRVVGIASELLASGQIDSVGFAITSNDVINLLRKHKSPFAKPAEGKKLEGPELAKRVTPAVAFLKVKTGPGGVAMKERKALLFNSIYITRTPNSVTRGSDNGKLLIDSSGEVVAFDGDSMIPFLFESAGMMGIEQLPGDDRETWSTFRFVSFATATATSSPLPLPSYYRPPS